jgi:DinB superfamily
MSIDWNAQLVDQMDRHWQDQLRPRLDDLTDDEYFWEPVPRTWSVRRRAESTPSIAHGSGEYVMEYEWPEPTPPPVTTVAWRLGHIIVGVLGRRNAAHFGGPPCDYSTFGYAGTAGEALRQLDEAYAVWIKGVRGLSDDGLAQPCGPAEGPYAELSMAALVLHINRETIHHGAEVCLLRDIYRDRG